ncbi:hypothetical protein SAMN02910441_01523 [Ruminococcus sp. YE282]|nr:hypothetical protein SAMN02910441_01523 [Ruminococcus bromii]
MVLIQVTLNGKWKKMNKPLSVMVQEAKAEVMTVINRIGLPVELADLVLSSVLSDVRGQLTLEVLNYSKKIEQEINKQEGDENG